MGCICHQSRLEASNNICPDKALLQKPCLCKLETLDSKTILWAFVSFVHRAEECSTDMTNLPIQLLMNGFCMPGTVLGTGDPAGNKTHMVLALWKLHSREASKKQVSGD